MERTTTRAAMLQKIKRGRITAEHINASVRPRQLLASADAWAPIDRPCFGHPTSLLVYMLVCGYDKSLDDEPIEVVIDNKGNLEIHDGNHRITAAHAAGLKTIPVNIYYWDGAEKDYAFV